MPAWVVLQELLSLTRPSLYSLVMKRSLAYWEVGSVNLVMTAFWLLGDAGTWKNSAAHWGQMSIVIIAFANNLYHHLPSKPTYEVLHNGHNPNIFSLGTNKITPFDYCLKVWIITLRCLTIAGKFWEERKTWESLRNFCFIMTSPAMFLGPNQAYIGINAGKIQSGDWIRVISLSSENIKIDMVFFFFFPYICQAGASLH